MTASHSASGSFAISRNDGPPPIGAPVNAARSRPAENDRPSPRITTTRTSPGSPAPMSRSSAQVAGVWALSTSGRHSVTVATGPSRSTLTPDSVLMGLLRGKRGDHLSLGGRSRSGRYGVRMTSGGAAGGTAGGATGGASGGPPPARQVQDLAVWAGVVAAGLGLTAVAVALCTRLGTAGTPFLGEYRWALRPATLLAPLVALGVLAAVHRGALERLRWPTLLTMSYLAALVWAVALALVDGGHGLARPVLDPDEYRVDVVNVGDDPVGFLRGFVDNAASHAPATRGHPPGPVLLLWGLQRLGLDRPVAIGLLITAVGAVTVPLALACVRALCGEPAARRFAPVLVLAPYAVWTAVSLDAVVSTLDAAMVAAGVLASSPRRRGWGAAGWAAVAGLLLGLA